MAGTLVPGVAHAVAIAFAGEGAAALLGRDLLGFEKSPVSGIGVAVLLGLAIRHWLGLPAVYDAGLRLAVKRILRIGVALLGIRLSLGAAGRIGLVAAPIALACIATALLFVTWLGQRLGLERRLALLIAVGTSICGNTAIVATAPVIGANDDETSYAVGCITIFGLLALLVYPALSHLLFAGDATQAGIFLGIAIHDTAQVAGAGLMYAQQYGAPVALEAATVTKLVRNLFMLAVIPLVGRLVRALRARVRAQADAVLAARAALRAGVRRDDGAAHGRRPLGPPLRRAIAGELARADHSHHRRCEPLPRHGDGGDRSRHQHHEAARSRRAASRYRARRRAARGRARLRADPDLTSGSSSASARA
jgi:uncharacterized membrane protein YadS